MIESPIDGGPNKVLAIGEVPVKGSGRPDFAILADDLLAGHVELKAPGKGVDPTRFTGHDKRQWERFKTLPNVLYSDGNSWALYRSGVIEADAVLDIDFNKPKRPDLVKAERLRALLANFYSWAPPVANSPAELAAMLAPLCRNLRDGVLQAQNPKAKPESVCRRQLDGIMNLMGERVFAHGATDAQKRDVFADAFAQILTFGILLARIENSGPLPDLATASSVLQTHHFPLLSVILDEMTRGLHIRTEFDPAFSMLLRIVNRCDVKKISTPGKDPWIYFYEEFLKAYDEALRKAVGAYYTPVQIVGAQVRLVDELLRSKLGHATSFSAPEVLTLDPALGTGTFLAGIFDHTMATIPKGPGARAGVARALMKNLHGIELLAGPYAVAELRLAQAFNAEGAAGDLEIYLGNTLESPDIIPPKAAGLFDVEVSKHQTSILHLKKTKPVTVCIGNPPYLRGKRPKSNAENGGWVVLGDPSHPDKPVFDLFTDPVKRIGRGGEVKNSHNLYAYFWAWAAWKVFKQRPGAGIICFITGSSYLRGPAFGGMREVLREECDDIWILDLGGDGRGGAVDENVFSIGTPVAIGIAFRSANRTSIPARVHYHQITGTAATKLSDLDAIRNFASVPWQPISGKGQDQFAPSSTGNYSSWPLLVDLMPWQVTGVEGKRNWAVGKTKQHCLDRWNAFLDYPKGTTTSAPARATALLETRDIDVVATKKDFLPPNKNLPPLSSLPKGTPPLRVEQIGWRSFDRRWVLCDPRVLDYPRASLWTIAGKDQVYIATTTAQQVCSGPVCTVSAYVPDRNFYHGRGSKDVIPFYRKADTTVPNLLPGLVAALSGSYGKSVVADQVLSYFYGILGTPAFTKRHKNDLMSREIRVPITGDFKLFTAMAVLGKELLAAHTFQERFVAPGHTKGAVVSGHAVFTKGIGPALPTTHFYDAANKCLQIGPGKIEKVSPAVWGYEVNGFKVLDEWILARYASPKGKRNSPLDDIQPTGWDQAHDSELMELIWTLETAIALEANATSILSSIESGRLLVSANAGGVLPDPLPEKDPLRSGGKADDTNLALPEVKKSRMRRVKPS